MKEYKVYLIDIKYLDDSINLGELLYNDEEFIKIAKEQNNVYNLDSFEELYNSVTDSIQRNSYIRIIETEI